MSDANTFYAAMSAARAWYYDAIRSIVDDAIDACSGRLACVDPDVESVARDAEKEDRPYLAKSIREGNPTHRVNRERDDGADPREFLTEWIDNATDSHQITTYTAQASLACAASDCESAYEENIGEQAPTVEAKACYAMRADCWQLLDARTDEWDLEDPTCAECGDPIHADRSPGVWLHGTADDTDHDADEDHVARPEVP